MPYPNAGVDSKPASTTRIRFPFLPAGLFALLLLAVYADPLFARRNFVGRDLIAFGLPMEKMVHDAWSRGRLPVWSEDLSGGRPLLANPSSGSLYPMRPLLSRLPFPVAMRVFPVAQWFLGGLGMLLALRALGASAAGGWIAAATFVFSGVAISLVCYLPNLPAATLLPWVLWASARPARGIGGRAVPSGIVFGLLLLLGDAFVLAIGLLIAVLWIACEVGRRERLRETGWLLAGLGLAALLAAPQIVATTLLVPETYRAVTGFPVREALVFTLSPWRLAELVVPYPFGRFWTLDDRDVWSSAAFRPLYSTIYCGAFAVVAIVALRKDRGTGSRFARTLFLIGAALAIVFRFVPESLREKTSWIPLRHPEKFSAAIVLGLAVLAGLAVDRFRSGLRRPAWVLWGAALIATAAVVAAKFPARVGALAASWTGASPGAALDAGNSLAAALAEAGLLWTLTVLALALLPGGRGALLAGVAILTLVPIAANRRIARTAHEASVLAPTTFARTIARRDPQGAFRTLDERVYRSLSPLSAVPFGDPYRIESDRQAWYWVTPALWHRGTVLNLDPDLGDLSRMSSLRRASGFAADASSGAPFGALSLRFGIRYRDQPPLPGFARFGGDHLRDWDENPDSFPDMRLLEGWREERGPVEALRALPALSRGEVVVETGDPGAGAARPGRLTVLEKSPERLRLATENPDPTWLFVLRGFWPYRAIFVDGEKATAAPAQLAFSALRLAAGRHQIEWREEAPGFALSRWGPVLFALASAVLLRKRPAEEARS